MWGCGLGEAVAGVITTSAKQWVLGKVWFSGVYLPLVFNDGILKLG